MTFSQERYKQIEQELQKQYQLLTEYDRLIGLEADPRQRKQYENTQNEVRRRIAALEQELEELRPIIAASSDTDTFFQFISDLSAEDLVKRLKAVYALGEVGDKRAVGPLVKVLRGDPEPIVRGNAIQALGKIGDESALNDLVWVKQNDYGEYALEGGIMNKIGEIGPLTSALTKAFTNYFKVLPFGLNKIKVKDLAPYAINAIKKANKK